MDDHERTDLPIGAELLEREQPEQGDLLAISLARKGASDELLRAVAGDDQVPRIRELAERQSEAEAVADAETSVEA